MSGLALGLGIGAVVALVVHLLRPDLILDVGPILPFLFIGLFLTLGPLVVAAAVASGPKRIARLRHAVATAPAEGRLLPARIDSIAERPHPGDATMVRLTIGLSVAPSHGEPWATIVTPLLPRAARSRFRIGDTVAVARLVDGHANVVIAEGAGVRHAMRDAAFQIAQLPPREKLVVRGLGRLPLEAETTLAARTPPIRGGLARFLLASFCTLLGVMVLLVPLRTELAAAVTGTTTRGVAVASRDQTDDYFDAAVFETALAQLAEEAGSAQVRSITVVSDGLCAVAADGAVHSRGADQDGTLCDTGVDDAVPFDTASIDPGAVRAAVDAARTNAGVTADEYESGTFGPEVSIRVPAGNVAPIISVDLAFEAAGTSSSTFHSEVTGAEALPLLGAGSAAAAVDEIVAATDIELVEQVTIADDALCVYANGALVGSKVLGGSCAAAAVRQGQPFPIRSIAWDRIGELIADARARTDAIPYAEQNLSAAYGPQVDVRGEGGAPRIEVGVFFESQVTTSTVTYTADGDFASAWPPPEAG